MTKSAAEEAVSDAVRGPTPAHPRVILLISSTIGLMTVLDVSIVNVALPAMDASLGLTATNLQWVVNAYSLTFAGFLLLGGRAADLIGPKPILLYGLVIFTVASLVGGFAQTGWQLVGARAIQGLGGALLAPVSLSLLTTTFAEPQAKARAIGIWGGVAAVGGALGSVVGGLLTGLLSWRWVLFVNVPVGVLLMGAAAWGLPHAVRRAVRGRLDLPGSLAVTLGTAGLIAGIIGAERDGWTSPATVGLLASAIALLILFVVIEHRALHPLVPLSMFRNRALSLGNVLSMLTAGVLPFTFYFLSIFLQVEQGMNAVHAGFALMPAAIGISAGNQLAPLLLRRAPARAVVLTGSALTSGALVWLSRLQPGDSYTQGVLGPLFISMVGFGISGLPMTIAATSGVRRDQAGVASGLINTSRQVGGAVGMACLVALAAAVSSSSLGDGSGPTGEFGTALLVGAALVLVGGLGGWALPHSHPPPPESGMI